MTEIKRTISEDDRLKALALVTIGNELYRQAVECHMQVARVLGLPEGFGESKCEELIYSDDTFTIAQFDQHLRWDGIAVGDRTETS